MALPNCSVCLDTLDETSRMLPCEHTYHQKCLLSLYENKNELKCCLCRQITPVDGNKVTETIEALPPGIILLEEARRQRREEINRVLREDVRYTQMEKEINEKDMLLENKDDLLDKYKSVVAVGGIAVGVAALAGVGAYLFSSRNKEKDRENRENNS